MILVVTGAAGPPLPPSPNGMALVRVRPADLSRAGWRWDPHRPGAGQLVTEGGPVELADLTGVLCCLTAVTPADLPHVAPADQPFVAAEMTAFLTAWLTALACPVLNAPKVDCLAGAGLRRAEWRAAAARTGVRVGPRMPTSLTGPTVRVGVAGDRVLTADPLAGACGRRLADDLGVALLAPVFGAGPSGPVLVDVMPWWLAPELGVATGLDLHLAASACR